MSANTETIRKMYAAFAAGDMPTVLGTFAPEIEWKEAEGFPTAGTYHGPDAVVKGVFQPLVTDWTAFEVRPEGFVGEGDTVVTYGTYAGTWKATNKSMEARFAHVWRLRDGRVVRFEQIVDSVPVQAALH